MTNAEAVSNFLRIAYRDGYVDDKTSIQLDKLAVALENNRYFN